MNKVRVATIEEMAESIKKQDCKLAKDNFNELLHNASTKENSKKKKYFLLRLLGL